MPQFLVVYADCLHPWGAGIALRPANRQDVLDTARLAKLLYPDADIRHQPFEQSKLADGYFDVAIGNIPFGDYKPFDPRFKGWNFLIHDYFFAAALEKVRSGGLIMFISSKGTLDKINGALREYVSQQADLIGAIRLPNDAFKKNANTEVTTNIVILRKRLPGELPSGPAWMFPPSGRGTTASWPGSVRSRMAASGTARRSKTNSSA